MRREFQKTRLLDNIIFLLEQQNRTAEELEKEAGVAPGYLSWMGMESEASPDPGFLVRAADVLNVSVDQLLIMNLTSLTPTEKYLMSFLEKLKNDTVSDKLDWVRESAESLNRLDRDESGKVGHPLFSYETYVAEAVCNYREEVSRVVFVSNAFDCHTVIEDDCFHLRMKNHRILYLMKIGRQPFRTGDPDAMATEVWMHSPGIGVQYVCGNRGGMSVAWAVDDLYQSVRENARYPKLRPDLRNVIDAFLQDDLGEETGDSAEASRTHGDNPSIRRLSFR